MKARLFNIFRRGSRTYFYSSIFFPAEVRDDVFALYSFVRMADDFVDSVPQQKENFYDFRELYHEAMKGKRTGNIVVDSFADLSGRQGFDRLWAESFLGSMEMDILKNTYSTIEETMEYMYGSAEVIGLFMSKIMGLDPESYTFAQMQGRAMQYINFIRDIDEDLRLGRSYLPLAGTGLESLEHAHVMQNRRAFTNFIREQISTYRAWQKEAEKGYAFIPKRYLIPVKTAADMYRWTADQIERDPLIVYRVKKKPSISRIVGTLGINAIKI